MSQQLILDTHILIWLANGDNNLGPAVRQIIKEQCRSQTLLS